MTSDEKYVLAKRDIPHGESPTGLEAVRKALGGDIRMTASILPTHDVDHVIEVVRQIIAEHPGASYADIYEQAGLDRDFAGDACKYYTFDADGARVPLCLVGQVLAKDGYLDEVEDQDEGASWSGMTNSDVAVTQHYTQEASEALNRLQLYQDADVGKPWEVILDLYLMRRERGDD
jgi:hypothetical protein